MPTPPSRAFALANPPAMPGPSRYAFSHVATVHAPARLVFVAGQGGGAEDGTRGVDFAGEVRSCLANVARALAHAGAEMADVYKLTVLVVDLTDERHDLLTAELQRAFAGGPYPAQQRGPRTPLLRTLIPVPRLSGPRMQIEIEATAALPA